VGTNAPAYLPGQRRKKFCNTATWNGQHVGDKVLLGEPVFGVVDGEQVLDELLIRLPNVAAAAFLRPEDHVVIQGIVDDGKTYFLTLLLLLFFCLK